MLRHHLTHPSTGRKTMGKVDKGKKTQPTSIRHFFTKDFIILLESTQ